MGSMAFGKDKIFALNKDFQVGHVNFPEGTRGVISKGGKVPHVEFIVDNKLEAIAATQDRLSLILVEAEKVRDEVLRDYEVKKTKFGLGQETNEIYLELFKGKKMVATGENDGRGGCNYLTWFDMEARNEVKAFLDQVTARQIAKERFTVEEDFITYLALYFKSGLMDFESFLKIDF